MKISSFAVLALVLPFVLAGCGGSGGNVTSASGDNPVVGLGNIIATQLQDEVRHRAAVDVVQEAARATPQEGSVTQSSSGVTGDSVNADVSYENGGLTFSLGDLGESGPFNIIGSGALSGRQGKTYRTQELLQTSSEGSLFVRVTTDREAPQTRPIPPSSVRLMEGDRLRFDYTRDEYSTRLTALTQDVISNKIEFVAIERYLLEEVLVGYVNGIRGTFSCPSTSPPDPLFCSNILDIEVRGLHLDMPDEDDAPLQSSISSINVRFTPSSSTGTETVPDNDYLVGGTWLFVPHGDDLSELEIGAFSNGPDANLTPASYLQTDRSATYSGKGSGLYLEEGGAVRSATDTNRRVGNFDADVVLDATFGNDPTIGGKVENIRIDGISQDVGIPSVLSLNNADITNEKGGFFTGATSATALKTDGISTYAYTGKWGGQFYGDEADYIGGTFGASTSDNPNDGDYKASFIGTFGADKQ